jgi:hypothetical protein
MAADFVVTEKVVCWGCVPIYQTLFSQTFVNSYDFVTISLIKKSNAQWKT